MNEMIQLEAGAHHALVKEFEKLAALNDGWLDGAGRALPQRALAWLSAQLITTLPNGMALPFVCATPTGGVFLEWTHGDWIVSAEIPLPERRSLLQATNTRTSETVDDDCALNDPGDFGAIYHFVGRFA